MMVLMNQTSTVVVGSNSFLTGTELSTHTMILLSEKQTNPVPRGDTRKAMQDELEHLMTNALWMQKTASSSITG